MFTADACINLCDFVDYSCLIFVKSSLKFINKISQNKILPILFVHISEILGNLMLVDYLVKST